MHAKNVLPFLAALALATCFSTASHAADPIKIGIAGAHSGDLASYGLPTVKAAELVVKDINAKGGINGSQIELLVEDDECKPEKATNAATKLITNKASIVIGHICSGATKAALPLYRDAKIMVISPSATDSSLTLSGDYPNFFRTIGPNFDQAPTMVNFATDKLGLKKIAVIHDKGDYGKSLADDSKALLEKKKAINVVLYEGITPGAVDYSAIVQKIKQSGAEAVIYGGYHPEASKIVSLMRKKKIKIAFISDDGVKDDTFIKVAGEYAEGVYATGPADVSTSAMSQQFRKAHKDTYKEDPGAFFDNAVTATLAVTNAIAKAGSTDLAAVSKVMKSEKVTTPFGAIQFNEKGDPVGIGYAIYVVKNGKYVQVP